MRRSSLRWIIPLFLALQLGLLWVQGAQLHRQNQLLQALREDLQLLSESLESSQGPASFEDDGSVVPADRPVRQAPAPQVARLAPEEEQDPAARELKAARDSAQKAVKDGREMQSKLSIQDNIRRVEEAKKLDSATRSWQGWAIGALAVVVLALLARAWMQRRS